MSDNIVTIKVSEETRRSLRMIAAMTGETQQEVAERVMKAELDRVKKEQSEIQS